MMKYKSGITSKKPAIIMLALIIPLIILLLIPEACALGITPAKKIIDFEPNLEQTVVISIINSEHKDMKVLMYAEGELSEFITFQNEEIVFSANESEKTASYSIKLPNKIKEPGIKETKIIAREIPKESKGEIVITTTLAVFSQLNVRVPYPGKYPQFELHVSETMVNDMAYFIVPVTNLGSEKIRSAKVVIEISDPLRGKVTEIETNEASIEPKQRKELLGSWNADVNPGFYNVVATLIYDGEKTSIEKGLIVKGFFIKVLDISAKNFKIGQIAKLNILLENMANKDIKEIETRILLNDEAEKIADVKSNPVDISAFAKKEAISYWDTEGVLKGEYLGKVILNYAEESSESQIRAKVGEDSIKTEIFDLTGRVAGGAPDEEISAERSSAERVILLLMIIVIIVNVIIFLKRKRSKKFK